MEGLARNRRENLLPCYSVMFLVFPCYSMRPFTRIVACLLIPCLITDPVSASALNSPLSLGAIGPMRPWTDGPASSESKGCWGGPAQIRFEEEALAARYFFTNLRIFSRKGGPRPRIFGSTPHLNQGLPRPESLSLPPAASIAAPANSIEPASMQPELQAGFDLIREDRDAKKWSPKPHYVAIKSFSFVQISLETTPVAGEGIVQFTLIKWGIERPDKKGATLELILRLPGQPDTFMFAGDEEGFRENIQDALEKARPILRLAVQPVTPTDESGKSGSWLTFRNIILAASILAAGVDIENKPTSSHFLNTAKIVLGVTTLSLLGLAIASLFTMADEVTRHAAPIAGALTGPHTQNQTHLWSSGLWSMGIVLGIGMVLVAIAPRFFDWRILHPINSWKNLTLDRRILRSLDMFDYQKRPYWMPDGDRRSGELEDFLRGPLETVPDEYPDYVRAKFVAHRVGLRDGWMDEEMVNALDRHLTFLMDRPANVQEMAETIRQLRGNRWWPRMTERKAKELIAAAEQMYNPHRISPTNTEEAAPPATNKIQEMSEAALLLVGSGIGLAVVIGGFFAASDYPHFGTTLVALGVSLISLLLLIHFVPRYYATKERRLGAAA